MKDFADVESRKRAAKKRWTKLDAAYRRATDPKDKMNLGRRALAADIEADTGRAPGDYKVVDGKLVRLF